MFSLKVTCGQTFIKGAATESADLDGIIDAEGFSDGEDRRIDRNPALAADTVGVWEGHSSYL